VRMLAEGGEQARIARLLAPVALIPVAAAFFANLGVRAGFYGPDVRMLLITELSATALLLLSLWAAARLGGEREALHESQDRMAQAVAAYDLGIFDYHPRTGQIVFSAEMERMLGLEPGGLHGDFETWLGYMLPDDLERNRAESAVATEQRLPKRNYRIKVRRADGEVRDLHGVVRYIYGEDGESVRMIGINMDVTDQVRDREALAVRDARLMELQSELVHVSRLSAMGEMASALAHELNQPLTAVGNFLGAIEMSLGEDGHTPNPTALTRVRRAVKLASAQSLRAGEIVRRLREFIARGEADTRTENLALLVDDAIALVTPSAKAADVDIRRELHPASVLVDRVQVQQVLVNLLRNAIEAMRGQAPPRVLTIRSTAKGGMVEVAVADSGPGVAADVATMLFTPFMSTKGAGMGVGLSICRRIIEAHGGEMWLEPGGADGAEFRFTLPLMQGEDEDDSR
jgi:two-component system sensor kinase FixL